ncbi:hypothetical protein SAMN05892883_3778 [Jatrophihabitans sp. GAS493]|uniref:ABC transporter permease n=1 Tax=Jatrophihabitans sp. GAS493 TaxID=1907575 RepID=UPI000BB7FCA8|nr:transporter [Jatrophihabitans sp. GAS493]SOD74592.1 hypothetical protein SAMN05892883_3778 [Jatrophihabitans sp. GAS493]
MTWLTWRQFRTQGLAVCALLAALAIMLAFTGFDLRHIYTVGGLATCPSNPNCGGPNYDAFLSHYAPVRQLLGPLLLVLPAAIGVFWGAPLVAGELESGTFRMVWTQGVSRVRWLTAKVAIVGVAAVGITGLASLVVTWWYSQIDEVNNSRFQEDIFNERNIAPIGYAAFAFALGVCAGILLRRTLPAMAVTLVGYIVMQVLVLTSIRPHFRSPLRAVGPIDPPPGILPKTGTPAVGLTHSGDWIISNYVTDASGHSVSSIEIRPDSECLNTGHCLADYQQHVTYQPAGRYWTFQWYEFSLYVGLAAILIGLSFWLIRRRLS